MKNKAYIDYCELGFLPISLAFCDSQKKWSKEINRLGITDAQNMLVDNAPARCWSFQRGADAIIIICIDKETYKNNSKIEVLGLIAHECTHAIRFIFESIGETNPSSEIEAYLLQAIFQFCISKTKALE